MTIYKVFNFYVPTSLKRHFNLYLIPRIEDIAVRNNCANILKCDNEKHILRFIKYNDEYEKYIILRDNKDSYFSIRNIYGFNKNIHSYNICLHNGIYVYTNAEFYINIKNNKGILPLMKNLMLSDYK